MGAGVELGTAPWQGSPQWSFSEQTPANKLCHSFRKLCTAFCQKLPVLTSHLPPEHNLCEQIERGACCTAACPCQVSHAGSHAGCWQQRQKKGFNGGRGPCLSDPGPFLRPRRLQWRQAASWHNCSGVPMPRVILDHSQDVLSSA